jgi:hypothetical protein
MLLLPGGKVTFCHVPNIWDETNFKEPSIVEVYSQIDNLVVELESWEPG